MLYVFYIFFYDVFFLYLYLPLLLFKNKQIEKSNCNSFFVNPYTSSTKEKRKKKRSALY